MPDLKSIYLSVLLVLVYMKGQIHLTSIKTLKVLLLYILQEGGIV